MCTRMDDGGICGGTSESCALDSSTIILAVGLCSSSVFRMVAPSLEMVTSPFGETIILSMPRGPKLRCASIAGQIQPPSSSPHTHTHMTVKQVSMPPELRHHKPRADCIANLSGADDVHHPDVFLFRVFILCLAGSPRRRECGARTSSSTSRSGDWLRNSLSYTGHGREMSSRGGLRVLLPPL